MYKLVLYYLLFLVMVALTFCFTGILSYNPIAFLFSSLFITTLCLVANRMFAYAFKAPTNAESAYITALILTLIITPPTFPYDMSFFALATWASILAMASKYIFALKRKHVFNPAALALALTAVMISQSGTWWVGTLSMAPFVLAGGLLITRKIQRFDLVLSFFITALVVVLVSQSEGEYLTNVWRLAVSTPLLFFAFVMLTEPLTTPPGRWLRIAYGVLVGFLFSPGIHVGSVYSTPELALVAGNVFSYLVSPKQKLLLVLQNRILLAQGMYDFIFTSKERLSFKPGQYLEWTLDRSLADSRGNRRYFTIASSPTEKEIVMGVKFYPHPSSFKKDLLEMKKGDTLVASQLSGDFVLPKDEKKKLVFIAGGIGVTPFRSMIKYVVDKREQRDIVLFYSNKTLGDIAYREVWNDASRILGIKTVFAVTDPSSREYTGTVNHEMIKREVPDYQERYFYISGPRSMVVGFEETLKKLGVKKSHIKTDFFPGFV